jgi:hypothetical protein
MKIKTDFVTNSSSSCFIVVFPEKIKTLEQVLKFIPEKDKAQQVYKDAIDSKEYKIQTKIAQKIITTELSYGFISDISENYHEETFEEFLKQQGLEIDRKNPNYINLGNIYYENERRKTEIEAKKYAKEFIEKNSKGFVYIFNYGDEDGKFFAKMEHGHTFKNLPHIRISHH